MTGAQARRARASRRREHAAAVAALEETPSPSAVGSGKRTRAPHHLRHEPTSCHCRPLAFPPVYCSAHSHTVQ
jgi:hypothetical protein